MLNQEVLKYLQIFISNLVSHSYNFLKKFLKNNASEVVLQSGKIK